MRRLSLAQEISNGMNKGTIAAVIALLIILGIVFWFQRDREEQAFKEVKLSVSVYNQTKNADASTVPASSGDSVVFTLNAENPNGEVVEGFVVEANATDIQDIATLTGAEGANYNPSSGSLLWTPLDIPLDGSIQKKFTVRIKDDFPATSDLVMKLKFGNEVSVPVERSQVAGETSTVATDTGGGASPGAGDFRSPNTGPSTWLVWLFASIATALVIRARRKRLI